MLPAPVDRPKPLAHRMRTAVQPYVDVVVPGAMTGAIYLLGAGHWQAFKQALALRGVPISVTAVAAPLVAVLAFFGIRYLLRQLTDGSEAEQ